MSHPARYSRERKKPLCRILAVCIPAVFLAAALSQAVFATTYIITDGTRVYACAAFSSDPEAILDAAGLELDKRDTYTLDTSTAITIRRAMSVRILYHGEAITAASDGETVGELLARLGILPDRQDTLSLPPDTPVRDGLEIRIDRIERQLQTYSAVIPRRVITCRSQALPEGTEEILVPGRDGELLCRAEVTYVNGTEARREMLRQDVLLPPMASIIAQGTGAAPADSGLPQITARTITLPTGEVVTYSRTASIRATAYTHTDPGCNMITATGSTVHIGTVAVDPRFIPYGTRMFIMATDGSYVYGVCEAEDCGGDIVGDRVDLYLPTFEDCIAFGRRDCTAYFLG